MEDKRYIMTFEQFVNEANGDGTGPEGKGPKTGKKKGDCDKTDEELEAEEKAKNEATETGQEAEEVPAVLYHAIKAEDAKVVKKEGLIPINEDVVFLTDSGDAAKKAVVEEDGETDILILEIDAAKMVEDGLIFDTALKVDWYAIDKVEPKYFI